MYIKYKIISQLLHHFFWTSPLPFSGILSASSIWHPLHLVFIYSTSEDVCKRGFTVIIDMRGSKWELIKPLLKTLQEFFPAEICVALIIKPDNFWQKQKTNFGSAKFSFEVSGFWLFYPTQSESVKEIKSDMLQGKNVFTVRVLP